MNTPHSSEAQQRRFDCEHELHLYLLNNLEAIEPGLKLYGRETMDGLEFKCLGKKLDLLTEDRDDGLLAIEVKFNHGRSDALGQLLGYIAVIRRMRRFAGRTIRGLIVCSRPSEHLLLAAEDAQCVAIYEFAQDGSLIHHLEAARPVRINDWTA